MRKTAGYWITLALVLSALASVFFDVGFVSAAVGAKKFRIPPALPNEKKPTCVSCHKLPPDCGRHQLHAIYMGFHCSRCHFKVIAPDGTLLPGKLHANKKIDVNFRDGGEFREGTCNNHQCHDKRKWD